MPKSDNLFFTIDYKLPSSGMTDKMIWNNFINLRPCDVIKFVIGSDEDMNLTIDIVKKLKQVYTEMPHIYLGAVYGMYDAQKLVNIMLKDACALMTQHFKFNFTRLSGIRKKEVFK